MSFSNSNLIYKRANQIIGNSYSLCTQGAHCMITFHPELCLHLLDSEQPSQEKMKSTF